MLDKVQDGKIGMVEDLRFEERVILGQLSNLRAATEERLEDQKILYREFVEQIERQQGMPEVIEHAHEKDDVKLLAQIANGVDIELPELDVGADHLRGKTDLR